MKPVLIRKHTFDMLEKTIKRAVEVEVVAVASNEDQAQEWISKQSPQEAFEAMDGRRYPFFSTQVIETTVGFEEIITCASCGKQPRLTTCSACTNQ
jgi:hypothetical protein